jgi:hypothetical protein
MKKVVHLQQCWCRRQAVQEARSSGPGAPEDLQALRSALSIGWVSSGIARQRETKRVSLKDAYKIRRIYRRLTKMRGRGQLHRLTVFIRHENVVRLLEFLGYPQEE